MIVRRCSAITASEYLELALRTEADCSRAKTKFLLGYELLFALPALRFRTPRIAPSTFPRSATPAEGDRVRTRFSVMTGVTRYFAWDEEYRLPNYYSDHDRRSRPHAKTAH